MERTVAHASIARLPRRGIEAGRPQDLRVSASPWLVSLIVGPDQGATASVISSIRSRTAGSPSTM